MRILLAILLTATLFAQEDDAANPFLSTTLRFAHNSPIPKVNLVTGEYVESDCDLTIAGCQPLAATRFYGHQGTKSMHYGHWLLNPEHHHLYSFASIGSCEKFIRIGERDGSFITYHKKGERSTFSFDSNAQKGFTNHGGQHPLNVHVQYLKERPINRHEKKKPYRYTGEIKDGSGRRRTFWTERKIWKTSTGETNVNYAPPYQAMIAEEYLPNGNVICYEYEKALSKDQKISPFASEHFLLKSITAKDSTETKILGSLKFAYQKKNFKKGMLPKKIFIKGSDGRKATLSIAIHKFKKKSPFRKVSWSSNKDTHYDATLERVSTPNKPLFEFKHHTKSPAKDYSNHLYRFGIDSDHSFRTTYDSQNRVSTQSTPAGLLARFTYNSDHTIVENGEGHKTTYHFDDDKRIIAISTKDRVERNQWDPLTGNLLQHTIEDPSGKIYLKETYTYDENQNPITHTIGDYTLYRTYSKDGFNLLLSETDGGRKKVTYSYKPNTNLLRATLIYENDKIVKRTFHSYNTWAVCVETITDDGTSPDPTDLTSVTYRRTTKITPIEKAPCIGLPKEVATYDLSNNLISRKTYTYHPSGQIKKECTYDSSNKLCSTTAHDYDSYERLKSTKDPLGNKTEYKYDKYFNLIEINGPHKTRIDYDNAGRPTTFHIANTTTTRTYNTLNQCTSETDRFGQKTTYTYDAQGNCTSITAPDGGITTKTYDPLGNPTTSTDPLGYTTHTTYDYRSQPLTITHPDQTTESFTYNPNGTCSSHTDKNGLTTHYTYDIFNNVIQTSNSFKTTTSTYSPFHKLSETNPEGNTTTFTYDTAGRKICERFLDRVTTFTYDSLSRLNSTTCGQNTTQLTYDAKNRITSKRTPLNLTIFRYDASDNKTHIITPSGTTRTRYNEFNQPITHTNALCELTTYTYGPDNTVTTSHPDNTSTITTYNCHNKPTEILILNPDSLPISRHFTLYDLNNNPISTTYDIYQDTTYLGTTTHSSTYGPCNRLEHYTESGTKHTHYTYNTHGQLATITQPNGIQIHHTYDLLGRLTRYNTTDTDYRYTYDTADRLVHISDGTTRTYDPYGNLTSETLANNLTLSSTYNAYNQRTALTLPNQTEVTHTYANNLPLSTTYGKHTTTYSYTHNSQPSTITLPNNAQITYTYDKLNRPTEITSPYHSETLSYTYANLTQHNDTSYTYDDLNQLTSESSTTYTYDSTHNRTSQNDTPIPLNYLNQITTYTYDANGNLLSDDENTYIYDTLNRLTTLQTPKQTYHFTYDALNRRLSQNDTDFLYDGTHEIGSYCKSKLQDLRILSPSNRTTLIYLKSKPHIPLHDYRGNITTLLTLKGKSKISTTYSAFGIPSSTPPPWGFQATRHTPLPYFSNRYYLPSQGRWLTPDPLFHADGPNLYAYVHNNPLTYIDPTGLSKEQLNSTKYDYHFRTDTGLRHDYNFIDYESRYENTKRQNRSFFTVYNPNKHPFDPYHAVMFTNGMWNSIYDATQHVSMLSRRLGGIPIYMQYNASHGFWADNKENFLLMRESTTTNPIFAIHQSWNFFFTHAAPTGRILQYVHSQGAFHLNAALENYPEKLRNRIRVVAVCPGRPIHPTLCENVRHYVPPLYRDIVSAFAWRCADATTRETFTTVPLHPRAKLHTHSFSDPTFGWHIEDEGWNFLNENFS